MANLVRRYSPSEEAFYRNLIRPEERLLYASAKGSGGYRWFRSPNIIPFEKYQRVRLTENGQQVA
jgi:hypothetical protein